MNDWIAIVDENTDRLRIAAKLFANEGIKLSTLRTKGELAGFLAGNSPDLIIFGADNPKNIIARIKNDPDIGKTVGRDPLTGLYDEATARLKISESLSESAGVLLLISLYGFELVEGVYGKRISDELFRRFSGLISSSVRSQDPVGRYGRNMFIAFGENIREDCVVNEKRDYLQAMITDIASELMGPENAVPLKVCVGAVVCPDEGRDFSDLISKAEEAAYYASEEPDKGCHIYWSHRQPRDDVRIPADDEMIALLSERESLNGAYVLPFEQFRTVCRLMIRLKNYHEVHSVLIRFTISCRSADITKKRECADHFLSLSSSSLRTSDVMTIRGEERVSILLTYTDWQYGGTVAERIISRWQISDYADEATITYDIHQFF